MEYLIMFVLVTLIPALLTGMWLTTAIRCWKGESKWRKIFAAIVTSVCLIGIGVILYCYFFDGDGSTLGVVFLYCIAAFVLFIVHCFFTKKYWGILGIVATLYVTFWLLNASLNCDFSIRKRRCLFQDRDDIVQILSIKNLPDCHYNRAWTACEYAGDVQVQFDYDHPDSAKIAEFLATLQKENPTQCSTDSNFSHIKLKYSTIFTDSASGKLQYANFRFIDGGFYFGYGGCWEDPESLHQWLADSLQYDMPTSEMTAFEVSQYGPDYSWEASFKLDKPMTEKDISRLLHAANRKKNWQFFRDDDGCGVTYQLRDGDYVSYSKALRLKKDENGRFSRVIVSRIDY